MSESFNRIIDSHRKQLDKFIKEEKWGQAQVCIRALSKDIKLYTGR